MTPGDGDGYRWKKGMNQSFGAASEVRRIDPAEYQSCAPVPSKRPAPNKTKALLKAANKILVTDAKRRHGKRYAKRVQNMILTGHYR